MKFNRVLAIAITVLIGAFILFAAMIALLLTGKYIAGSITAILMFCCTFVAAGIFGGMEQ